MVFFDYKHGCALPMNINPSYRGALGYAFLREVDRICAVS